MLKSDDPTRTYLYVPYEERAQVERLGAHWDDNRKCWYIRSDQQAAPFQQWLGVADSESTLNDFVIESAQAYVAVAKSDCSRCSKEIEVICIYCENGKVEGEAFEKFTVSNITAVDEHLKKHL